MTTLSKHPFTGPAILALLLLMAGPAGGTTYYVSPAGSDTSSGDFDHPFKTIPKAVGLAIAGDTIYVRGGTHVYNTTINISKAGTGAAWYHLYAYPGERPLLDFSSMPTSSSLRGINLSGSFWHVKGLDIFRAGDNGMLLRGHDNIIEFCSFFENRDTGLQLSNGAANNQVINCDSYYNKDTTQGNADGFAVKLDVGTGNSLYGCRAWQNSDDGYDGYMRGANDVATTLVNCWIFRNGYLKSGGQSTGNGNGFKLGGSDSANLQHDELLINCLAFDNRVKGFDQNNDRGSMTLLNCTGFRNGTNYSISLSLAAGESLKISNCVALGSTGSIGGFAIQQTNSWMAPFVVTNDDFVSIDTTGVRGPRKEDGSLPDVAFLHLATGSDLINAGTDVGLPYIGTAPDLGCFESDVLVAVNEERSNGPEGFSLGQNYPNPFNPSTRIEFRIAKFEFVTVKVYDVLGREVATLVNEKKQPGAYSVVWNAGIRPSGVYYCRMQAGEFVETRTLVLTK